MFHLQNNPSSPCNPEASNMLMQQSRNAMSMHAAVPSDLSHQLNQYNAWYVMTSISLQSIT